MHLSHTHSCCALHVHMHLLTALVCAPPPLTSVCVYMHRCAGCLLLVSLLQLCVGSGLIAAQLPQLQDTFTGLLGDANDLTQVGVGGGLAGCARNCVRQ